MKQRNEHPGHPRLSFVPILILPLLLLAGSVEAQENEVCLECHGDEELKPLTGDLSRSLFVVEEAIATSVHEGSACIDCHADLADQEFTPETPHAVAVRTVVCAECHEDEASVYAASRHGLLLAEGDPLAPTCADCHGTHGILHSSHNDATTAFQSVPRLCGSCHKEGAPVERDREIPQDRVLGHYSQSIHGEGLFNKGLRTTAVCTSCHTAHDVRLHDDPRSTIHRDQVSQTCMQCHILIEEVHRQVIRGELWEEEPHKIPVCVDCHSPHEIRKVFYDEGVADGDCLECHGDPFLSMVREGETVTLFVDQVQHLESMHRRVACAQCHQGATPSGGFRPCSTIVDPVDCSVCHAEAVDEHDRGIHGQRAALLDPEAPGCSDCHDHHFTGGKEQPNSPTFPTNVPALCGKCHREGASAAAREAPNGEHDIVARYTMSVHGKGLLKSGLLMTAVCTDCHSTHMPLPASDPASSVHRDNVAETCAKCHHGIYEQFAESVHATGRGQNGQSPPTCRDCHSSHEISRVDKGEFERGIVERCGRCHEEVTKTYFDTFHGKVSRLGEDAAAKCHHCHGAHDVLPVSDPRSRLSRENIVGTCQQCHEDAHRRFAGYVTHATHHSRTKYPFLFYSFWSMTLLLIITLIVAGIHTGLWLWRGLREPEPHVSPIVAPIRHVTRFSPFRRWLHFVLLISFLGLAITGMVLKFSYMGWARGLSHLMGGFEAAGYIHRVSAVITFGYFVAHLMELWRLASKNGFRSLLDPSTTMLPTRRDVADVKATWRWFLGKGPHPSYGRWTYWEKFDYFAVFGGVVILGCTGLLLWFPEAFTYVLPGKFINVATIIHSDQALLVAGFIFTVHFFNTHLRPGKFPMDPVMFTGSVPLEEFKRERSVEYEELVVTGRLTDLLVRPRSREYHRLIRAFGLSALALGLLLIGLIIYATLFGYR